MAAPLPIETAVSPQEQADYVQTGMKENDPPATDVIPRDAPEIEPDRQALVARIQAQVLTDRNYWETNAFKKMRELMHFAAGSQWPSTGTDPDKMMYLDPTDQRYVANVILRHINHRTATLYGKNPTFVARRKERIWSKLWDENLETINARMQSIMTAVQTGAMPDPEDVLMLQEAQQVLQIKEQVGKLARTLELLFEYELAEQTLPFKVQMKQTIRRALTTGVGWVKLGFQRVMELGPEEQRSIADASERLAVLERLAADVADGVVFEGTSEIEELKQLIRSISASGDQVVVREGLQISYPESTAIIPDRATRQLRGFVGASRVTEQYMLSADRIKEIYHKDVSMGGGATGYSVRDDGSYSRAEGATGNSSGTDRDTDKELFCVWETYDQSTGMVYVTCDGYGDFLVEPAEPDVYIERFWPWFGFVTNEVYDEQVVYPPSDVALLMDMQKEINRARQGLREHRRAARPRTFAKQGALTEEDKKKITTSQAHALVEVSSLQDDQKITDVVFPFAGSGVDPNLYDTTPSYTDLMRVTGTQEANLGGTSGATATETTIAEGSRVTTMASVVDDLDEFLSEFAREAGNVLFAEMSAQTVMDVVGPGAFWPQLSRDAIAKQVFLDVEAASSGRPNKQAEIQVVQQIAPLLLQIPGIKPEGLARELVRRFDDRLDLTDMFQAGLPSIQAMNRVLQSTGAAPGMDPNMQGGEGVNNNADPATPRVNVAPTSPDPQPVVQN